MPLWSGYKEQAHSRGSLAYELYVVESVPAKAPEELKKRLVKSAAIGISVYELPR